MKKTYLLIALLLTWAKVGAQETANPTKFIEVTGSSEMEINPDEITLIIVIEEYWNEEYNSKSSIQKFKTKRSIQEIEKDLFRDLHKIGILKDRINITEIGNHWKYKGKESLLNKQFEVIIRDFSQVDSIVCSLDTKGISYIMLGPLKNHKITEYRKQVKIEALKAAKDKAGYLLESMDKKAGDVISITEMGESNGSSWNPHYLTSNSVMATADYLGIENTRKIKLRYEIKARFEILTTYDK